MKRTMRIKITNDTIISKLLIVIFLCVFNGLAADAVERHGKWVSEAKKVHRKFKGTAGTLAIFGDSLSSRAYVHPLAKSAPVYDDAKEQKAFTIVNNHIKLKELKKLGPDLGNGGNKKIEEVAQHIDKWLETIKPEICLFMYGSGELSTTSSSDYEKHLYECIKKIKASGCICILSTLPPNAHRDGKVIEFNRVIREAAVKHRLPLQDFNKEILSRRPKDWNGSLAKFGEGDEYEVETLIARDGKHPSNPSTIGPHVFKEDTLKKSGFALRNYLAIRDLAVIIDRVTKKKKK